MTRLITAPCVGASTSALEGGIIFAILSNIEVEQGAFSGVNDELIYVAILFGGIMGIIVGKVIGLIVALLNAGSLRGLLLVILVRITLWFYLFVKSSHQKDIMMIHPVIVVPSPDSPWLISPTLTSRHYAQ